jgi:capsid portal protein
MWLLKHFGMLTSLVLDTVKAKLNSMPILLATDALELQFRNMSSKNMRSTFAIRITMGNTERNNKFRSSYGRAIQSTSTLATIKKLTLKRGS